MQSAVAAAVAQGDTNANQDDAIKRWLRASIPVAIKTAHPWDRINAASLAASCAVFILMRHRRAFMDSQCRSCDAHGCHCGAKNQLGEICHDSSSSSGQTRRCFVIDAQKIGLHCRKVHHVFLNKHRSSLFGSKLAHATSRPALRSSLRGKRTSTRSKPMSGFDPKRKSSSQICCDAHGLPPALDVVRYFPCRSRLSVPLPYGLALSL